MLAGIETRWEGASAIFWSDSGILRSYPVCDAVWRR
jgi:hypothetical protein